MLFDSAESGSGHLERLPMRARRSTNICVKSILRYLPFRSDLEDSVLVHGRQLREDIMDIDKREDGVFAVSNDPVVGVTMDKTWLEAQFRSLDALEHERRQRIKTFASQLEDIEQERSRTLGSRLKDLAKALIEISHELEPGVERIIDRYSTELNLVTVNNRSDHADVLARLDKTAVTSHKRMFQRWADTEKAWRLLKHHDAVASFQKLLDSEVFTHPPARVAALASLSDSMRNRHDSKRAPLIEGLGALRPPQLTIRTVSAMKAELEAIEAEDQADCANRFIGVRSVQEEVLADARHALEGLRLTLHGYEALKPAGKLPQLGERLDDGLQDPLLDPFFRKANGLKVELVALAAAAKANDTIYEGPLTNLRARVSLVVDSFQFGPALAATGKAVERNALLTTLDNMRAAKRTDIPALVVKLHKLVSSALRVPGIPMSVVSELESIMESLGELIEEVHDALLAANVEVPQPVLRFLVPDQYSSTGSLGSGGVGVGDRGGSVYAGSEIGSTVGRSVVGKSTSGGGGARSTARSKTRGGTSVAGKSQTGRSGSVGSRGSRGTKSSRRSRKSAGMRSEHVSILSEMTDPLSSVMGRVLPMQAIRAMQRRVAVVAASCDLPEDLRSVLKQLVVGCDLQMEANVAVDAVVHDEGLPKITAREKEAMALLDRIQTALRSQSSRLKDSGERICTYMREVARAINDHSKAEKAADDGVSEELNGALDHYEDNDNRLEDAFAAASKRVREAPTLPALEDRTGVALKALDSIESQYRSYADTVMKWTRIHPDRIASILRVHRRALCQLFGLEFPAAMQVDGEPIPGEESPHGLQWTLYGPRPAQAPPDLLPPGKQLRISSSTSSSPPSSPRPVTTGGASPSSPRASSPSPRAGSSGRLGLPAASSSRRMSVVSNVSERDPSVLEPLRQAVEDGLLDPEPDGGGSRGSDSESKVGDQVAASATLQIAPAQPINITYAAGHDLAALNLSSSIVPAPQQQSTPATYAVKLQPSLLARYMLDAESVLAPAASSLEINTSVGQADAAPGQTSTSPVAAAPAPAVASANAKDNKKKSKAELELEAKAAEEAAAAAAAAEVERQARIAAEAAARAVEEEKAKAALAVSFPHGLLDSKTGMPLDRSGAPCIPHLAVSQETVAFVIVSLRGFLLSSFEQYAAERRRMMAELATARSAAFTAELEERLRRHWPRKGVLEVVCRAPREGELIEHRLRLDRHVRRVQEKDSELQQAFDGWQADAKAGIEQTMERVAALESSLPTQTNLAALQGVAQRCRQLKIAYQSENEASTKAAHKRVAEDTAKLMSLGEDFIASCTRFSEGGVYDGDEVQLYQNDLSALHEQLQASSATRDAAVAAVEAQQAGSYSRFDAFTIAYDKALKDLSMREGLGPKYGAPRRDATSTIRTAIAHSEEVASQIDMRLEELRALLQCSPGEPVPRAVPCGNPLGSQEEELEILRAGKGLHEALGAPRPVEALATPMVDAKTPAAGSKSKPGTAAAPAATVPVAAPAPATTTGAPPGLPPAAIAAADASKARELDEDMLLSRGPAPLAVRLRRCVTVLRDLLYQRAVHLDALKTVPDLYGGLRQFSLPFLSMADCPPGCTLQDAGSNATTLQLPAVHVPAAYPTVHAKDSLVLPMGSGPAPGTTPPSPVYQTEAWLALNTPGSNTAPHTIKGPSPSPACVVSREAQRFMAIVALAVDKCKADTRILYVEDGQKLPEGDAGLPESLRRWLGEQSKKTADLREFSARRLRDQADVLASMLPAVPSVLASDILARSLSEAGADNGKRMRVYKAQAMALEDARHGHLDALRIGLSDPNAAPALSDLVDREARRVAELRGVITSARASAIGSRSRQARVFAARLSHNTSLFMLAAEECLVREDMAPLPGDEFAMPKKLGFKRLHKTLRRAGDQSHAIADVALGADADQLGLELGITSESPTTQNADGGSGGKPGTATPGKPPTANASASKPGTAGQGKAGSTIAAAAASGAALPAAIDTGKPTDGAKAARDVFAQRAWPGMPHPDLMFQLSPHEAHGLTLLPASGQPAAGATATSQVPPTPSAASASAGKPATPAAAGKPTTPAAAVGSAPGTASLASAQTATAAAPPATIGAVTCIYGSWSRHAVQERDSTYRQYCDAFRQAVDPIATRFDEALDEVGRWEAAWLGKVGTLKASNSAASQPEFRAMLDPPPTPPAAQDATLPAEAPLQPEPRADTRAESRASKR